MLIDGLVTTIIPVYNRPDLLREAVASVLEQDYRPIEIIIVDDGSTDQTGQVADSLAARHGREIRVIHLPNSGPGRAREAGRQAARGEFIQYLDSDDLLLPGKFSVQVTALRAAPQCGISYGKTAYGDRLSKAWKRTGERIPTLWPSILQERWWDTSTPLYRRTVTDAAPGWIPLHHEEDWVYDCRIASMGVALCYCDVFVSNTRENALNRLSGNTASPTFWQARAEAHQLIWECVLAVGPDYNQPEQRHFVRELFLLARQCGAAGLGPESRRLFELSRWAAGEVRGRGWDYKLYHFAASVAGWQIMGRLSGWLDRVRR